MEKISGIVPTSPRINAVDMREAAPVRPGTPTFGRPEGVSTLRSEAPLTTVQKGELALKNQLDWKSKDEQHAAFAAEISNRFFMKNIKPAQTDEVSLEADEALNTAPMAAPIESIAANERDETSVPLGLYPKGSFIDYQV